MKIKSIRRGPYTAYYNTFTRCWMIYDNQNRANIYAGRRPDTCKDCIDFLRFTEVKA